MLRVGLAQVNATVGDLAGNAEIIVEWTRRAAARGARVVVFPEMALTGYPVEDLALRASFVEASVAAVRDVAERLNVEGLGGVAVVVGYLDRRAGLAPRTGLPAGAPLDAAAVLHGGQVVITSAKHHLPNYGVFDEFRYFVPGDTCPVFRLPVEAAGGAGPRPSTSRSRSARTCGRTAGRSRSPGTRAPRCSWCRTPRRTSGARTTCALTWCSGGPGRRGRRSRTATWSAGRTSSSSTGTPSSCRRPGSCWPAGRSSRRR